MTELVTPVAAMTPLPTTRGQIPALASGQVVDARVLAIIESGVVRLAIAGLMLDAATTAPLKPGTAVRLLVEEEAGALKLSVVERPPATTPQPEMAHRLPAAGDSPPLDRALAQLAARQTSLAPLFADLARLIATARPDTAAPAMPTAPAPAPASSAASAPVPAPSAAPVRATAAPAAAAPAPEAAAPPVAGPRLPPAVLDAAAQLLRFRLPVGDTVAPGEVRTAFLRSGVLHEAKAPAPAAAVPQGGAPAEPNSLRAMLATLPALPAPAASPLAAADLKSALVDLRVALLAALGGDAAKGAPVAPVRMAPPRPPRHGEAPRAQAAAAPLLPPDAPPHEMLRTLLAETDGALARLTLCQIASSGADAADAPGAAPARADPAAPGWTFEVPLLVAGHTSIAQFEIRRDDAKAAPGATAEGGWSVRFSLDVEPQGPVHGALTLRGQLLSVALWAERPATVEQLKAEIDGFALALAAETLTLERAFVHAGRPDAAPAPARHLVDRVT